MAVDGASTQGLSLEAVQTMLLGPEGSTCLVSLYRGEDGLYFEVPLLRHSAHDDLQLEDGRKMSPGTANDGDGAVSRSAEAEEAGETGRRIFMALKCNARYAPTVVRMITAALLSGVLTRVREGFSGPSGMYKRSQGGWSEA